MSVLSLSYLLPFSSSLELAVSSACVAHNFVRTRINYVESREENKELGLLSTQFQVNRITHLIQRIYIGITHMKTHRFILLTLAQLSLKHINRTLLLMIPRHHTSQ